MNKGMLIDGFGRTAIFGSGVCYAAIIVIAAIIGATGPAAVGSASNPSADLKAPCDDFATCQPEWIGTLTDMTPLHQMMWVTMVLDRPVDRVTGVPLQLAAAYDFSLPYELDVAGADSIKGVQSTIVKNTTHVAQLHCAAHALQCEGVILFAHSHLTHHTYFTRLRFKSPYAAWAGLPAADPWVKMHFTMNYIQKSYTNFEMGFRYFFVVIAAVAWLSYSVLLRWGPGTKGEDGKRLPSEWQQRWAWGLGFLLIWFNNPLAYLSITDPTLAYTGFSVFCTVTFLCSLLLYWLLSFDLARIQGEAGLRWETDPRQLGFCFYVPKTLLLAVFWTISLAGTMWQSYVQLQDPAYSIFEAFPLIREWFAAFAGVLGGIYMVWLVILIVLSCRSLKSLRPSNKFIIGITLLTILITLSSLFSEAFGASLFTPSLVFLQAYTAANVYVLWLMFCFLPAPKAEWWVDMVAGPEGPATAANGGGGGAGAARLAEMASTQVDTTGVLGDTELDEADVELGAEEAEEAEQRTGAGAGAGAAAMPAAPAAATATAAGRGRRQPAPAPAKAAKAAPAPAPAPVPAESFEIGIEDEEDEEDGGAPAPAPAPAPATPGRAAARAAASAAAAASSSASATASGVDK